MTARSTTWIPEDSSQLSQLIAECKASGVIEFCHPQKRLSAGRVIEHATRKVQAMFAKHEPLIYKFGFTHNPIWRWANDLYGYCRSKDKWSGMIILFVSNEANGPAFLEACLIDKFSSILAASYIYRRTAGSSSKSKILRNLTFV